MIGSLTTLVELAVTGLYCAVSAVIPVLNAEAYLIAVATHTGVGFIGWLALAAAVGQVAGKMLFFAMGRGALMPRWLGRRARPRGKWLDRVQRWQQWAGRHTWGSATVTFGSAVVGLPPLAVWSVLAGSLRMRAWVFASCVVSGRYVRFIGVLALPAIVRAMWA